MLIKVKDEGGKWVLFDNAEGVQYDQDCEELTDERDIAYYNAQDGTITVSTVLPNIDWQKVSDKTPLRVKVINFTRNQKRHVVIFSTLTYICNDQGKTVEKVEVR